MNKLWSYPKIVLVSALLAIGLLASKLLLRLVTRPEAIIRGDEFEDTILWFALCVVVFAIQRSSLARANAMTEIREGDANEESSTSRQRE